MFDYFWCWIIFDFWCVVDCDEIYIDLYSVIYFTMYKEEHVYILETKVIQG